jgi:hypothetical protein
VLAPGVFVFRPTTSNLVRVSLSTQNAPLAPRIPANTWRHASLRQRPIIVSKAHKKSLHVIEIARGGNPERWIGRTRYDTIVYPCQTRHEVYTAVRRQVRIVQPNWHVQAIDGRHYVIEERVPGKNLLVIDEQRRLQVVEKLVHDVILSAHFSLATAQSLRLPVEKTIESESGADHLVPSHGDLNARNVLISGTDGYCVIDWDADYLRLLPPYHDLVTLIISLVANPNPENLRIPDVVSILTASGHIAKALQALQSQMGQTCAIDDVARKWHSTRMAMQAHMQHDRSV